MIQDGLAPVCPDVQDDRTIVQRILGGEQAAFGALMRRYNQQLYRLARSIVREDAEAEDALQDAYMSAYRSLGQFRGESSLSTWLSRMVINQCLSRMRRQERRQNVIPMAPSPSDEELDRVASDESGSPDAATDRAQMHRLLESKIDALPESFRAVFVLRSVQELTVDETADCLGIPAETVRTRHFRARSLLREALAREMDLAERDIFRFAGERCDRLIARVLADLFPERDRSST